MAIIIEVTAEVGKAMFFMTESKSLNAGIVESVDAEVFVKVRNIETGDVHILKPEQLYDKAAALAYVDEKKREIESLSASLMTQ